MDKRSFQSGIDNLAFNYLKKEDEVENLYSTVENGKLTTVFERLTWTGKLVRYKGSPKLVYSYLKKVTVDLEEASHLGENKLVVINNSSNGYIMDELTL